MDSKYVVSYSDDKSEVTNYYYKFVFIERIFDEDTDDPGIYTIIYANPLQPEARKLSIFPEYTKDHEMAVLFPGISMPDGGIMDCPYDMEKKELLIDETMWELKGRTLPTKEEYDIYNESIKAVIEFLRNEYVGRKKPIRPKFIDKNIEELCIIGTIKDYSSED